jgi:hypothetical protein
VEEVKTQKRVSFSHAEKLAIANGVKKWYYDKTIWVKIKKDNADVLSGRNNGQIKIVRLANWIKTV